MNSAHEFRSRGRGAVLARRVLGSLVTLLLLLTVVIPNSFQSATAVVLAITAVLALPYVSWGGGFARLLLFYLLACFVTTLFIFVGLQRGAPLVASLQTFFVYIVSPLLWLLVSCGAIRGLGGKWIIDRFAVMSVLAAATVGVFYFLFLTVGPHSVSFFIDNANLNLKDGYAGATMFVYGSLIFLAGGFLAAPSVLRSRMRILVLVCLIISTITSGRSALLLCVPIGLLVGAVCAPKVRGATVNQQAGLVKTARQVAVLAGSFCVVLGVLSLTTDVDVLYISSLFLDKLLSGGGSERSLQAVALANGVADFYGFGAGHGVGVDLVRSGRFPWRYELVWLATLHRVGFLGALVYALPFVVSFTVAWRLWRRAEISQIDVFMLSGLLCAFVASNTNPYIEAFVFQWMYILPVTWFFLRGARELEARTP